MSHWDPQRFLLDGRSRPDVNPIVLQNAVATASALHAKNPYLPPLFSLRYLAHETGVPYKFLRSVIDREDDPYRVFKLSKPNAGHAVDRFRFICAPHPLLLKAQRWLNAEILSKVPVSKASYAYRSNHGIICAATLHVGCKWLIKLDVTNFFESILEPEVYKVFHDFGYQPLVAFELARLCTRIRVKGNPVQDSSAKRAGMPYKELAIGHLPQGAATSPLLANLASRELDSALLSFALDHGLVYSRYADDLVFSSHGAFLRQDALDRVHDVYKILRRHRLWPNRAKTKIVTPGARKIVLGLLVDRDRVRLTAEFKDRVRTHIHFLSRDDVGPARHAERRGFDSVYGLQRHVYGLVAFAHGIEPIWAKTMLTALAKVKWPKFEGF